MLDPKLIVDAFNATVAPLEAELAAAKTGLEPLVQEAAGLRAALTEQTLKVTALDTDRDGFRLEAAWRRKAMQGPPVDFKVAVPQATPEALAYVQGLEAENKRLQGLEATYKSEVVGLRKELDDLKLKIKVA